MNILSIPQKKFDNFRYIDMKVKELIETLQQFAPECEVMIEADRLDVPYGAITSVCENCFAKEPTVEITFGW